MIYGIYYTRQRLTNLHQFLWWHLGLQIRCTLWKMVLATFSETWAHRFVLLCPGGTWVESSGKQTCSGKGPGFTTRHSWVCNPAPPRFLRVWLWPSHCTLSLRVLRMLFNRKIYKTGSIAVDGARESSKKKNLTSPAPAWNLPAVTSALWVKPSLAHISRAQTLFGSLVKPTSSFLECFK